MGNEEYGSQRKNSLLFFYQPEITGPEPVIDNNTLDLSLSDRIAKTIFSMRITVIIYAGTIYKICLAINAYSEIATLPWKSQLALATGGLYDGDLLCGIRFGPQLRGDSGTEKDRNSEQDDVFHGRKFRANVRQLLLHVV